MRLQRVGRAIRVPIGRSLVPLLGWIAVAVCGPPAPPDAPTEVQEVTPAEDRFQPPRPAPEPAAVPVATELGLSGSFAHEAHADVRCLTCHPSVQGHARHAIVECGECHPAPAGTGTVESSTEDACLTCHHLRQTVRGCADCHGGLPGRVIPVEQVLDLSVASSLITRSLDFDHASHVDRSCATCHTPTPRETVALGCADCHDAHHQADSDCAGCHTPSPLGAHDEAAHRSCVGSGCHGPDAAALPTSRSACLTCHTAQSDHEPGGDCSTCHLFDSRGVGAPGIGGRPE